MDKTKEIFDLVVAENVTEGKYGLSVNTTALLSANPGLHSESEASQFVLEVVGMCMSFPEFVEYLIQSLKDIQSGSKESDLQALKEMTSWTIDPNKIDALALEEWERRRKYKIAGLTMSPVTSIGNISF